MNKPKQVDLHFQTSNFLTQLEDQALKLKEKQKKMKMMIEEKLSADIIIEAINFETKQIFFRTKSSQGARRALKQLRTTLTLLLGVEGPAWHLKLLGE